MRCHTSVLGVRGALAVLVTFAAAAQPASHRHVAHSASTLNTLRCIEISPCQVTCYKDEHIYSTRDASVWRDVWYLLPFPRINRLARRIPHTPSGGAMACLTRSHTMRETRESGCPFAWMSSALNQPKGVCQQVKPWACNWCCAASSAARAASGRPNSPKRCAKECSTTR